MTDVISVPIPTNVFLNTLVSGGKVYLQHKLTYSFNFDPDPSKQFPEWLPYEKAAFKTAINEWGKVANISFTEKAVGADFVEFKDPFHNELPAGSLGQHDTPDRLLIPEKLYGRAREIPPSPWHMARRSCYSAAVPCPVASRS